MFEKILFATTASPACDNAAKVAFDLELKWNAKLYLFHVLGIPSRGYSPYITDVRTGELEEPDQDYIDWVIEEMRNTYGVLLEESEATIDAVVGVPYREILRKARKEDIDLIIMGAHNRDEDVGASRYRDVIGSTMRKVAKSARCPVVIISRPCTTCWKLFSNIVFGTDFSKPADSAFMFAYQLAKEVGAKLHMFHACDISSIASGKVLGQEDIEKMIETAKSKMKSRYASKMNGYDNFSIEAREGIPYVEILKYARERQGDLIVMAHHEQVVLRSACPVASVNHPDKVVSV